MVGMMGAGKTAIGTALAKHLDVPFLDSDAEISRAANRTIAEIFERDGEGFFRARESEVIRSLLEGPPCILSTGGGAWLSAENRDVISAKAAVVWLKADLEVLWSRVNHRDTRPLLMTDDPKATLAALQSVREPEYAKAQFTVEVDGGWSIAETTRVVADILRDGGIIDDA